MFGSQYKPPLLRLARPRHYHHARQKPHRQHMYLLLAFLCLFVGLASHFKAIVWHIRRANDAAQRLGRFYAGRSEILDPSPRCCASEDCLATDKGRYAVITSLRSNRYLPLVEELACSLKRTNPDLPLIVYAVPGELSSYVEARVRNITELRYWRDIYFPSQRQDGRFSLNWVKLRAWELEEFDAVLMVDSDITVLGDLSHVFKLPTAFAAVPDQDTIAPAWWFGSLGRIQGGMLFLRPCRAVAQHMLAVLQRNRLLQYEYEYAEQDFLDWYFKFDRWLLPLEYNSVVPISVGNKTLGGMLVRAIHFTKHKPYVRNPAVPQHWYLTCTAMEPLDVGNTGGVIVRGGRRFGGKLGSSQVRTGAGTRPGDVDGENSSELVVGGQVHRQQLRGQQQQQSGPKPADSSSVASQSTVQTVPQPAKPASGSNLVANATLSMMRGAQPDNVGAGTSASAAAVDSQATPGEGATGQLSLEFTLPASMVTVKQQATSDSAGVAAHGSAAVQPGTATGTVSVDSRAGAQAGVPHANSHGKGAAAAAATSQTSHVLPDQRRQ